MKNSNIFVRLLVGAGYGFLLGWGIAISTGSNIWICILPAVIAGIGVITLSETWFFAILTIGFGVVALFCSWTWTWVEFWDWGRSGAEVIGTTDVSCSVALFGSCTVDKIVVDSSVSKSLSVAIAKSVTLSSGVSVISAYVVQQIANYNNITPKLLIDIHIAWLFSLPTLLIRFLSYYHSSTRTNKLHNKQRALDVRLIVTFTQELTEVFPEEWDEWQHWIRDMIDSRTRMQAKGMSHRLVSLITFYRLTRFVFHIGIDKVFILATRRATR